MLIAGWRFISHQDVAKFWFIATGGASSVSAGTQVKALPCLAGARRYALAYAKKIEQKTAPSEGWGRWWGVMGYRDQRPSAAASIRTPIPDKIGEKFSWSEQWRAMEASGNVASMERSEKIWKLVVDSVNGCKGFVRWDGAVTWGRVSNTEGVENVRRYVEKAGLQDCLSAESPEN